MAPGAQPFVAIVNPAAGGGRCGRRAPAVLASLGEAGIACEVHATSAPGHASELAHRARESGHTRFLCLGGDGTVFEVLNGIDPGQGGEPCLLASLPLGTGNSFLRDFGITGFEAALDALVRGGRRRCDAVRVEHSGGTLHYLNILSLAFSARAGSLMNRRLKPLGPLGYILAVLGCVAGLSHPVIPVSLDAGEVDRRPCTLLSFSNSRYTGGTMMMAPLADPTDGALDVIRVGRMGRLGLTATFPRIFKGTHVKHPAVEQTRARTVDFVEPSMQDVMVDGEIMRLEIRRLSVVPGAIDVIA